MEDRLFEEEDPPVLKREKEKKKDGEARRDFARGALRALSVPRGLEGRSEG